MLVTIYKNFSKRINSTKIPSDSGIEKDVKLKENCSISSPVFILKGVDLEYNYLNFNNRYYFISDIVPVANNLVELHCSVDLLATFRTQILSMNTFVERSSSEYDELINDECISQKQSLEKRQMLFTPIEADAFSTTGTYFIRIVNSTGGSLTGVDTFINSLSGLFDMLSWIYNLDNFDFLTDLETQWTQAIFNPAQYILSIYWLPVSYSAIEGHFQDFKYGFWDTGKRIRVLDKKGITFDQQVSIPENVYNDFRKYNSKWTRISIYVTGLGQVEIDPIYLSKSNVINVTFYLDLATGDVTCTITSGSSSETNNDIITIMTGNWCVPFQIGYSESIIGNAISSATNIASNIISRNITGTVSSVANAVESIASPKPNVIGDVGSIYTFSSELKDIIVTLECFESAEIPNSILGRPLYKNKTLSSLSGFTKCTNASIDINGLEGEKDAVNNYLNNGFYIE